MVPRKRGGIPGRSLRWVGIMGLLGTMNYLSLSKALSLLPVQKQLFPRRPGCVLQPLLGFASYLDARLHLLMLDFLIPELVAVCALYFLNLLSVCNLSRRWKHHVFQGPIRSRRRKHRVFQGPIRSRRRKKSVFQGPISSLSDAPPRIECCGV